MLGRKQEAVVLFKELGWQIIHHTWGFVVCESGLSVNYWMSSPALYLEEISGGREQRVVCVFHAYSRQGVSILYSTWAKYGPLSVFISKVLLEHSTVIGLRAVYGCIWTARAELSSCNRDYIACKGENIYYVFLYRRNLPTPMLDSNNLSFYSAQKVFHTYYFRQITQWIRIFYQS